MKLVCHLSSRPDSPPVPNSTCFSQSRIHLAFCGAIAVGQRFQKKKKRTKQPLQRVPPLEYTPVARSAGPESRRPLPIECSLAAPPGPGPAHSPAGNKRIWLHARHTGSYDSRTVTLATQGPPAPPHELPRRNKCREAHRGT